MSVCVVFTLRGPPVLWWTLSILLPSLGFVACYLLAFALKMSAHILIQVDRPRFCLVVLLRSLFLIPLCFHLSHSEGWHVDIHIP